MTGMAVSRAAQSAQGWPCPVLNQPANHRHRDRKPNQHQPGDTLVSCFHGAELSGTSSGSTRRGDFGAELDAMK
jgi:hypothetical protein